MYLRNIKLTKINCLIKNNRPFNKAKKFVKEVFLNLKKYLI